MSVDVALAPGCEPYTSFRKTFFALKAEQDVLAAATRAANKGVVSDCVDFQFKPDRSHSLAPHAQRAHPSSSRRDTRSDAGAQQQERAAAGTGAARGRSPAGIQTASLADRSSAPQAAGPQPYAKASTWHAPGYQ